MSVRKLSVYIDANRKTCGKCHYLPEWVSHTKYGVAMCGLYGSKVYRSKNGKSYVRMPECTENEMK